LKKYEKTDGMSGFIQIKKNTILNGSLEQYASATAWDLTLQWQDK